MNMSSAGSTRESAQTPAKRDEKRQPLIANGNSDDLSTLKKSAATLGADWTAQVETMGKLRQRLDALAGRYHDKINLLQQTVTSDKAKLTTYETTTAKLRQEVTAHQLEIAALKQAGIYNQATIRQRDTDMTRLNSDVVAKQTLVTKYLNEIARLKETVADKQAEQNRAADELQRCNQRLTLVQGQLDEMKAKLAASLAEHKLTKEQLEQREEQLTVTANVLSEEKARHTADKAAYANDKKADAGRFSALSNEHEQLCKAYDKFKVAIDKHTVETEAHDAKLLIILKSVRSFILKASPAVLTMYDAEEIIGNIRLLSVYIDLSGKAQKNEKDLLERLTTDCGKIKILDQKLYDRGIVLLNGVKRLFDSMQSPINPGNAETGVQMVR